MRSHRLLGPAMFVELTQAPKLETVSARRNIGERSRGCDHAYHQTIAPHSLLSSEKTACVSKGDSRLPAGSGSQRRTELLGTGTTIANRRWTARRRTWSRRKG